MICLTDGFMITFFHFLICLHSLRSPKLGLQLATHEQLRYTETSKRQLQDCERGKINIFTGRWFSHPLYTTIIHHKVPHPLQIILHHFNPKYLIRNPSIPQKRVTLVGGDTSKSLCMQHQLKKAHVVHNQNIIVHISIHDVFTDQLRDERKKKRNNLDYVVETVIAVVTKRRDGLVIYI